MNIVEPKPNLLSRQQMMDSRSLVSESKIEEIIACLWSLIWVILWVNHAPQWMLWVVGLKAAGDHLAAVILAIREIRSGNMK